MGFIQELADLVKKLDFFATIHEYEQGIYFRKGSAIPRRIRWNAKEKERLKIKEREYIECNGGYSRFLIPFMSPVLNDGYTRSFWTGLPQHPRRREENKVLRPGIYFYWPVYESVIVDSKQERVLNLWNISLPSSEDKEYNISISCNIRYEVMDLYKAYTAVHDYEVSLKDHTLSILAKQSRGKPDSFWRGNGESNNVKVNMEKLERAIEEELRSLVTQKWGLKVHKVYITDVSFAHNNRNFYDLAPGTIPPLEKIVQ